MTQGIRCWANPNWKNKLHYIVALGNYTLTQHKQIKQGIDELLLYSTHVIQSDNEQNLNIWRNIRVKLWVGSRKWLGIRVNKKVKVGVRLKERIIVQVRVWVRVRVQARIKVRLGVRVKRRIGRE